ncbi:DnaB-like helicase N-terminal domain-containing protein [Streptomyces sp. NPDC053750]|uniref:DnaB-like helicase N-terminal domain-containing protein n=1 Tax=Streptomyces sp. NPDC053750 TaxID=3365714 RepID=UPI0037CEA12C
MSTSTPSQSHDTSGDDLAPRDDKQPAVFTRVPPQDLQAEQAVIGSLLLSGSPNSAAYRYFGEILDTGLVAEEYYRPAHQLIHRAILDVHRAGEPVVSAYKWTWPWQDFREAGVCSRAPVTLRHESRHGR